MIAKLCSDFQWRKDFWNFLQTLIRAISASSDAWKPSLRSVALSSVPRKTLFFHIQYITFAVHRCVSLELRSEQLNEVNDANHQLEQRAKIPIISNSNSTSICMQTVIEVLAEIWGADTTLTIAQHWCQNIPPPLGAIYRCFFWLIRVRLKHNAIRISKLQFNCTYT